MVRITEDLIRKRAEHNNYELSTLEEVSLHQQDIEKIENLDKWCRNLKILYLQSNLIPKIENVGRLKKLEYLNLAINNITKIENLDGCESLKKLDLTVNFIADLTSVAALKGNNFIKDLYLTGNPCTQYEGYKEYVIATLPHLERLDGKEIGKSERILACQRYEEITNLILQQQEMNKKKQSEKTSKISPSTGTWYTNIENSSEGDAIIENNDSQTCENLTDEEKEKLYWSSPSQHTPESRVEMHNHIKEREELKSKDQCKYRNSEPPKREIRYFKDNGEPLNVNTSKLQFTLKDNEEYGFYTLDVACYKHLDTSFINVDVQPTYVRVSIKGHVLQLALRKEVNPDKSIAQRSQTTGHLVIKMPIAEDIVLPSTYKKFDDCKRMMGIPSKVAEGAASSKKHDDKRKGDGISLSDLAGIVKECENSCKGDNIISLSDNAEEEFLDNPEVPPLI